MTLPWHAGIAPVTVEMDWGDARHRITWRAGKVVLDHHRDSAAEAAWVALGGTSCPCLDILDGWDEWRRSPETLFRWADGREGRPFRSPFEVLEQLRRERQAVHSQLGRTPSLVGRAPPHAGRPSSRQRQQLLAQFDEEHRRRWRSTLLVLLPPALHDRLALSAVVGAVRQQHDRLVWQRWRPAVERALSARVVPALAESVRFWRGRADGRHRGPAVEAWVTSPGEPVSIYGLVDRAGGWAAASLLGTWLVEVWARRLAVVDGCFVLQVTGGRGHPGGGVDVLAARWERRSGDGSTPVIAPAVVVPVAPELWTLRWR